MYIFEIVYKIFCNLKDYKLPSKKVEEEERYLECEHVFLPVDSTKKVVACIKCGIIKHTD